MLRELICGADGFEFMGRELMPREPIADGEFTGRELIDPEFIDPAPKPRPPKFPLAVGGRGTDREPIEPFCGPRELLNTGPRLTGAAELLGPELLDRGLLNPGPRLAAPSDGRCCLLPFIGRCIPPV